MEDKVNKYDLGFNFKSKMAKDVRNAAEEVSDTNKKLKIYKEKAEERDKIVSLMIEKGIIRWDYDILEKLKDSFEKKYPDQLSVCVSELDNEIQKLKKMVEIK